MLIRRNEIPVFVVNLLYVLVFGSLSVGQANWEFVIYTGVIVVFFTLILIGQHRVQFPPFILWGLTLWGLLHMAGGHISVGGVRLYEVVPLRLATTEQYAILRYDQIIHTIGFGVATLVCHHLLSRHLAPDARPTVTLSALVVLMGMGLGAFNEVIELLVVFVVPDSGVGGYYNTALDLLFNMIGAILAVVLINVRAAARRRAAQGPTA